MGILRSLFAFPVIVLTVLVVGSSLTVLGLVRAPRSWMDVFYRAFGRAILFATWVKVTEVVRYVSPETLPDQLVVVANHESHLDTSVLTAALPTRSMRFIAKRQLFWIPIFGWAAWASGNIAVTRHDTKRDVAKLADPEARARDRDIMFFPEGTRSRDGNLAPFKKGPFAFALNNRRPILPVAIGGTRECLASHSLTPHGGEVVVVVGEPISVEGLGYEDREVLRDRTREALVPLREEALRLAGSPRARGHAGTGLAPQTSVSARGRGARGHSKW